MKSINITKRMPHPYVLLIMIIMLATIATYIVPAGQFDRIEDVNTGRMVVQAGTFHKVEQHPVSIFAFLLSIQKGLVSSAGIVFFIFLIGGAFGIVTATGSIQALLAKTIVKFEGTGNEKLILIAIPLFFGFMGATWGMYEETLVFMPFLVMLAMSLGYDAVVGISLGLLGVAAGFASAPLNPFTIGVAQGIAGLPLFSGMWYRWIFFVISMIVTIWYILNYASKVKKDPSKSYVKDVDYSDFKLTENIKGKEMTSAHKRVIMVFFGAIIVLIIGVLKYGWYIDELATLFLTMGIIAGLVYRMKLNDIAVNFVKGCEFLAYAAIIVGFARGVMVVMEDGTILDTIIYYLVQPLYHLPKFFAAGLMVPIQTLINFFIPSGSGQAMVTIPIMAPVSDLLGIPRQVAVLAYQYGDGFSNMFVPTLGATMAAIGIGRIPYTKWIAYVWKLLLLQVIVGTISCMIAALIGLGPF